VVELLLAGISATASLGQLIMAGRVALRHCVQDEQTVNALNERIQASFRRFAEQSETVRLEQMSTLHEQLSNEICVVLTTIRTSCHGKLPTKRLEQLAAQFRC